MINFFVQILIFRIKKPFETRWIKDVLSFFIFLNHYFES